jgi:hypothetical protein
LEPVTELAALVDAYVRAKVIPLKKGDDALHVAVCTIHEMDVLVSWNFEHLANVNKERRVALVNQAERYFYPLRITTPMELLGDEYRRRQSRKRCGKCGHGRTPAAAKSRIYRRVKPSTS